MPAVENTVTMTMVRVWEQCAPAGPAAGRCDLWSRVEAPQETPPRASPWPGAALLRQSQGFQDPHPSDTPSPTFTVAPPTAAKLWSQPRCPSASGWTKKDSGVCARVCKGMTLAVDRRTWECLGRGPRVSPGAGHLGHSDRRGQKRSPAD